MVDDVEKLQKFQTAKAIWQENSTVNNAVKDWAAVGILMASMIENQKSDKKAEDESFEKLQKLKNLFENWLIDGDEYKTKKANILENL